MRKPAYLIVMVLSAPALADTIDLYIISGQSNGFESRVEASDGVDPALTQVYPGIRYAYNDMYYNAATPWFTLRPRPLYSPSPGTGIGVEMSFATTIDPVSANPIAVIKAWRGGADLDEDFNPQAVDGLMAYSDMMVFLNTRIGELESQGHTVNLKGFVWIQGESDAAEGPEQAARYGDNLANFIDTVRDDLNNPALPFVYNRLNLGVDYADKLGVRAGQEWVAQHVPAVAMLDVDDVPLGPDTHHYDVTGKIELGYRFADALLQLNNPLPGDLNADGFVGIADLNIVLGNWNQNVTLSDSHADPSSDGYVGIEDLNIVLSNWNAGTPTPSESRIVPEPGVCCLLLTVFAIAGLRCRARIVWVAPVITLTFIGTTQTQASDSLINQGTRGWVTAATTGRADMLILGDSVVNHGLGWTGGIANAARTRLGIAGTGMYASLLSTGDLERYPGLGGGHLHMSASWFGPASDLGPELQGYAVGGNANVAPPGVSTFRQTVGIYDDLIDRSGAMTWQLWATMTSEVSGTLQANRVRRVLSPASGVVLGTSPAAAVDPYTGGLQLVVLPFGAAPGDVSDWHEFNLTASAGTAIFYNRIIDPNASGITVTGWGYPGGTVNNHYTNLYTADRSDAGRAGFIENITTQIDLITADWALAGLDPDDLSFTLPSTYQVGPEVIGAERVARLEVYRDALRHLALTDDRISFIDMWAVSPTAADANGSGMIHDHIHPSRGGSLMYGALLMDELLESTVIPGDLDGDGFVGLTDLNIVLGLWNQVYQEPWIDLSESKDYRADPNYDGFVGIADLNTVLGNWNTGTPPVDGVTLIPEPGSVSMLVLIGLLLRQRAR